MATAESHETNAELTDIGKCPLCQGDFKTPKLLPCIHSFCSSCLESNISGSDTETVHLLCPICNLKVPLSAGGVESLPENYLYNILIKKDNISSAKRECFHCQIQGSTMNADLQCLDCEDAFCNQCQNFHKLSSATRHHRLVPVEELKDGKLKQIQHFYCKKHSEGTRQLLLRVYCEKCKILHCDECMFDEEVHGLNLKNRWESLHKVKLETFTKEVDILLRNLKEQKEIVGVIQKVEERILEKRIAIESQIYEKAAEIQDLVEKVKNEKLSIVNEHFERELQTCKGLLEQEITRLKRLESTFTFAESFMKHTTEGEYLMHENNIKTRMADYLIERGKFEMKTEDLFLSCGPTGEVEQLVGDVIGQFESRKKYTDISGYEYVKFVPVIKGKIMLKLKAEVIDVAENGDIIAAGCGSDIELLNKKGESRRIVRHKNSVLHVAVKNNFFFIPENGNKLIVLDMDGKFKTSIELPGSSWGSTVHTTIRDEGTVFLSLSNPSSIYTCTLQNPKPKLFTSKEQQPGLVEPYNLSITPQGHLVVAMHSSRTIQTYSDQAELLWEFENENICLGLCCDIEGYIFIGSSETWGRKIHVIKDGILKGTIEIPNVKYIRGLAICPDGNLLVSHETNQLTEVSVWG